jgi:hypothetical protein
VNSRISLIFRFTAARLVLMAFLCIPLIHSTDCSSTCRGSTVGAPFFLPCPFSLRRSVVYGTWLSLAAFRVPFPAKHSSTAFSMSSFSQLNFFLTRVFPPSRTSTPARGPRFFAPPPCCVTPSASSPDAPSSLGRSEPGPEPAPGRLLLGASERARTALVRRAWGILDGGQLAALAALDLVRGLLSLAICLSWTSGAKIVSLV